jgi:hypothetical protein
MRRRDMRIMTALDDLGQPPLFFYFKATAFLGRALILHAVLIIAPQAVLTVLRRLPTSKLTDASPRYDNYDGAR